MSACKQPCNATRRMETWSEWGRQGVCEDGTDIADMDRSAKEHLERLQWVGCDGAKPTVSQVVKG